jgi:signal transduction histidine kinase
LQQKPGSEDETEVLKAEFNRMLDRLQTAFEMQDAFISNASHELRNPLTAIMGETEVALARTDRSTDDYIGSLNRILNEANRLEEISTALLRLAKASFDSRGFSSDSLRLDEMLWDVRRSVLAMNRNAQINIHLDHLPDDPDQLLVTGNEGLLAMAMSNIIGNACKFSANAPVEVTLSHAGEQLVIAVVDSGIGISATDLPHVFEPFFRSEGVRQIGGFGIGLPLSQRIVGVHGGQIKVESVVGAGTTVTVSLPRRTATGIAA